MGTLMAFIMRIAVIFISIILAIVFFIICEKALHKYQYKKIGYLRIHVFKIKTKYSALIFDKKKIHKQSFTNNNIQSFNEAFDQILLKYNIYRLEWLEQHSCILLQKDENTYQMLGIDDSILKKIDKTEYYQKMQV